MQALYPAEILNNEIRAKGVAFQSFVSGLASFINQYATPVALKNIGWKTYIIFCKSPLSLSLCMLITTVILHFVELLLLYLFAVETKGRSLEELDDIFESQHRVKKSLEKSTVVVKKGQGVTRVDDVAEI